MPETSNFLIDPLLSLAFTMHAQKGVYALLLGSGVSRAAKIPTGWDVTLDLVGKLAESMEGKRPSDLKQWFQDKYGEAPVYDKLLNMLAKSQDDRAALLRPYFEPTDDERDQGFKLPGAAHKAIARIMAAGYIRVVVTTNFDRLLEEALGKLGITPSVLSTPDLVGGSSPLAHLQHVIVKLNGDYVYPNTRNTPEELASYDPRVDALLDQVFDEYGLIVCGWSADYDTALRAALERAKSRRYTTYWTLLEQPTPTTARLIEHRKAETIRITGAETFLPELEEKLQSLSDIARPHPATVPMAVATLKRYLPELKSRIRLHDFIHQETERLCRNLTDGRFNLAADVNKESLEQRLRHYFSLTETLLSIMAAGCAFGESGQSTLWTKTLERVANLTIERSGAYGTWYTLVRYPVLLLAYAGGIAALAENRYYNLRAVLGLPKVRENQYESHLVQALLPAEILEPTTANRCLGTRDYTPVNNILNMQLRGTLRDYLPDDHRYQEFFDRFEIFFALVHMDLTFSDDLQEPAQLWVPVGRYAWRGMRLGGATVGLLGQEVAAADENWGPLQAGMFRGSVSRVKMLWTHLATYLDQNYRTWR